MHGELSSENFNPRSPDGERRPRVLIRCAPPYFNPRSPDGERPARAKRCRFSAYFNPRSPDGERPGHATIPPTLCYFNPRSPDGERPIGLDIRPVLQDFNPRSPDGERRIADGVLDRVRTISIHAPRMGSDVHFSRIIARGEFQSTLPGWGATYARMMVEHGEAFQSTLPGWGATRADKRLHLDRGISIHAPRMGSDLCPSRP